MFHLVFFLSLFFLITYHNLINPAKKRLDEISAAAAKEYSMEKAITKMKEDWADMQFDLVPYRETVIPA